MNKRITMKWLKYYFTHHWANAGETKEYQIRIYAGKFAKERYLKAFIKWVYERYGEGNISEGRHIFE